MEVELVNIVTGQESYRRKSEESTENQESKNINEGWNGERLG